MSYKVFFSHSTRDRRIVVALANVLAKFGIEVFVAEWYLTPGESIDNKIFAQIDKSDSVVVLLSQNGIRSNWVNQEIGYARKSNKRLIPLVEKGISQNDLASLQGREYIEYDPFLPEQSLVRASEYVMKLKTLKHEKEELEKTLLITGGILAFLLLLSGGEK